MKRLRSACTKGRPRWRRWARAFGAFGRWTPEHLSARFGDVEIEHVQGRDAERHYDELTPRLSVGAPLRDYIARVLGAERKLK